MNSTSRFTLKSNKRTEMPLNDRAESVVHRKVKRTEDNAIEEEVLAFKGLLKKIAGKGEESLEN